MKNRGDYYVSWKDELSIASLAAMARKQSKTNHNWKLDICEFITNYLVPYYIEKGRLSINCMKKLEPDSPAYVTYRPLVLHVDQDIWKAALEGEAHARYVLAHEVGHILMHDHDAKSFSENPELQISFGADEHSAEWQANIFAHYLMVGQTALEQIDGDAEVFSIQCGVPIEVAQTQIDRCENSARESAAREKHRSYEGDCCKSCGNFTMIRHGIEQRCNSCGAIGRKD